MCGTYISLALLSAKTRRASSIGRESIYARGGQEVGRISGLSFSFKNSTKNFAQERGLVFASSTSIGDVKYSFDN